MAVLHISLYAEMVGRGRRIADLDTAKRSPERGLAHRTQARNATKLLVVETNRTLAGRPPAIDEHGVARDQRRGRGGQEYDGAGDIHRLADAM